MKNKFLKKTIIISTFFLINVILNNTSNAYNDINTSNYISVMHTDLISKETQNIDICINETENTLLMYENQNRITNYFNAGISTHAIIGDTDERGLIADTTKYPYSAIAHVVSTFSDNSIGYGTAFLIAPNKAITNAHVIYDKNLGEIAKKIQIIPGKNGPFYWNNPFQSAYATDTYIPEQHKTTYGVPQNYVRFDWAVIKLNENIGNKCGWLGLQSGGITVGVDGPYYHLSGYPVHDINSSNYSEFRTDFLDEHYSEYQFHSTGRILSSQLHYLEHEIDMISGQSGSPIYMYDTNGNVKVVGINTAEEPRYFVLNYAKAITSEIINTATSF